MDVAGRRPQRPLAAAGRRGDAEFLAQRGMLLWQLTPFQSRHGERVELTLSLFDGAAPENAVAAALVDHGEAVATSPRARQAWRRTRCSSPDAA